MSDAHEVIRKITLAAEKKRLTFAQALAQEPEVLAKIGGKLADLDLVASPEDAPAWFEQPERYCGLAVEKAREIAGRWKEGIGKCSLITD